MSDDPQIEQKPGWSVKNFSSPTPKTWGRISTSLRYFLVGIIGLVSATDIIPPSKSKLWTLVLSGIILLLKSIDMGLGISPDHTE